MSKMQLIDAIVYLKILTRRKWSPNDVRHTLLLSKKQHIFGYKHPLTEAFKVPISSNTSNGICYHLC